MTAADETPPPGADRDPALDELTDHLGHRFARPALLIDALTHRSALAPADGGRKRGGRRAAASTGGPGFGYERLEFLGDRVLGLVIAELLLDAYPSEAEGALNRRYVDLVRRETLAEVAQAIDLGHLIRLPAIEEPAARRNPALLADVCEAIIAALYLDGGLAVARRFIVRHWVPRMQATLTPPKDAKTALQEWAQLRGKALPVYETVLTEGPPHQPRFTVAVTVDGVAGASATGPSKRLAEASAAQALLQRIEPAERTAP
ncbi:MAG TPA: ribonuclease III [Stellaceae bacterium]|nr:ribonuclease III [Stellaceae bacterium]